MVVVGTERNELVMWNDRNNGLGGDISEYLQMKEEGMGEEHDHVYDGASLLPKHAARFCSEWTSQIEAF